MKTSIIIIFSFFFILVATGQALSQDRIVKTTIKVYGNCEMCKDRIETALDRPGIKMAQWDSKTKNLEVVFNSRKIREDEIHRIIASVGHDTDQMKAKDEVYADLPFCCLYRDHDHTGIQDAEPHHDH